MSFPIYRHDKSWDAWVGGADDIDARWSTVKRPSIWKRLRSDDRRDTQPEFETIDTVAMTSEPADESADASETPERDSFWRRERSFGRRKSDDEPQNDEVEQELVTHPYLESIDAVAMTSEPADESADASETPERDSFWKRERSFGRRKSEDEPQNDEVEPELSWWSRGSRRGAGHC